MTYRCMILLVFVPGLLVSWSELLHVSGYQEGLIPRRCIDPPKQGNCGQGVGRFYFDMQTKRCQEFTYKGCEYSANLFVRSLDCINECQLYAEMAEEDDQPGVLPIRCIFPQKRGRCRARFPRYYYNTETKRCEKFIYGGCGANPNNFLNITDCIRMCEHFDEDVFGEN